MAGDSEDIPGGPLSEAERKAIRRIIRQHEREAWLWRLVRIWLGYIGATATVLFATWDYLMKLLAALIKTGPPGHP